MLQKLFTPGDTAYEKAALLPIVLRCLVALLRYHQGPTPKTPGAHAYAGAGVCMCKVRGTTLALLTEASVQQSEDLAGPWIFC